MKTRVKKIIFNVAILQLLFVSPLYFCKAQYDESKSLIRITGMIVEGSSNEPLKASVFYEKLPYYDDMGIAKSNEQNGVYELFMIENEKYIINVKADGYETISEEIEIVNNGTDLVEKNFRMKLDAAHEKFRLEDLIFARSRAVISESSYTGLDNFVEWLNKRPEVIIQLEGHTDFQGDAQANMQLSQERVDAVKKYLVRGGIKKGRIATKAFGGTQPLSRERTPEARTSNRRVEVRILQQ